jgi:hypothetical protein
MKQLFGNIFLSYLLAASLVFGVVYLFILPWIDR